MRPSPACTLWTTGTNRRMGMLGAGPDGDDCADTAVWIVSRGARSATGILGFIIIRCWSLAKVDRLVSLTK